MPDFSPVLDKLATLLTYDAAHPILFSSGLFLFLFAGFTFFYQFMRRAVLLRLIYVVCFSLYFYYKTSGIYCLLLIGLSISDFTIGYLLNISQKKWIRRFLLILSLTIDLGILCYFKYTNFFISIANDLAGHDWLEFRNIFLPVGISFFLFQSISYIVDLYKREIEPARQWIDYLFYLSFFPQLVAGPIVKARDFLPQIRQNPLVVTRSMFGTGLFLILAGLFKKAIISDYISLNFVDRVFDDPLLYSGFENLMGVYGYALQIYCDFSGYSDMAIGLALLLGFHFPKNFDSPYKSATITEFWRRWHISLSSWLRDYLYIPLGGSRKGRTRTYLNLMITMLLGGLWHGAAWRFVLWGGLHGIGLAIHKFIMGLFPSFKALGREMPWWRRAIGILITFHFVCLGWIFFRASDLQTGWEMIRQIFTDFDTSLIPDILIGYRTVFALILTGYLLHLLPDRCENWGERFVTRTPLLVQTLLVAILIWGIMQIKSSDIQPFIYFQF